MFERFSAEGHINDGYFLDVFTRRWHDPVFERSELDGLLLGGKDNPFDSSEDRLVGVVAPALRTEGEFIKPSGETFVIKRRRI
jgi:hypothetical protein